MTAEVKYYLDLDDVLAIRLDCLACHVSSSFPIRKLSKLPAVCPHCKEQEWVKPDTDLAQTTSDFLLSLGHMADALRGQNFTMRLEVNYEEPESPL